MTRYILDKSKLIDYLKQLDTVFEVWVPITEKGTTQFRPFDNQDNVDFDRIPGTSIKSLFQPPKEKMLDYSVSSDGIQLEENLPDTRKLIFGVRPCEARAIKLNSHLLIPDAEDENPDIYYKKRLQNTLFVGLGCNQPGVSCFCRSVGGDPFDETGLDAILTDLGETLLLEITGNAVAEKVLLQKEMLYVPAEKNLSLSQQIREKACRMMDGQHAFTVSEEDNQSLLSLTIWEELAERCLNCGVCTYLCPTCTCFDIVDYFEGGKGHQIRCWDSCMFSLFTQHASGHNPRPYKKDRLRQRFMHKLKYYPDQYNGEISCVGCGRCILYCPVNIDIREIADQITANGGQRG